MIAKSPVFDSLPKISYQLSISDRVFQNSNKLIRLRYQTSFGIFISLHVITIHLLTNHRLNVLTDVWDFSLISLFEFWTTRSDIDNWWNIFCRLSKTADLAIMIGHFRILAKIVLIFVFGGERTNTRYSPAALANTDTPHPRANHYTPPPPFWKRYIPWHPTY